MNGTQAGRYPGRLDTDNLTFPISPPLLSIIFIQPLTHDLQPRFDAPSTTQHPPVAARQPVIQNGLLRWRPSSASSLRSCIRHSPYPQHVHALHRRPSNHGSGMSLLAGSVAFRLGVNVFWLSVLAFTSFLSGLDIPPIRSIVQEPNEWAFFAIFVSEWEYGRDGINYFTTTTTFSNLFS